MMRNPTNDFYKDLSESTSLEDIEKVASTSIASIDDMEMEKISNLVESLGDEELQKLADALGDELDNEHFTDPLDEDWDEDDEDEDEDDYDEDDEDIESEASDNEIEMIKLAYDEAYLDLVNNESSINDYIVDAYQIDLQKLAGEEVIDHINKIASDNELNPLIVVDDVMGLWIQKSQDR